MLKDEAYPMDGLTGDSFPKRKSILYLVWTLHQRGSTFRLKQQQHQQVDLNQYQQHLLVDLEQYQQHLLVDKEPHQNLHEKGAFPHKQQISAWQ